jgi:predicted regulator of Ras-like GTPase activity (Roadblock/LC7/MglB family)
VNETDTIKRSIVDAHGTRVFVRTNGQAQPIERLARHGDDDDGDVAEAVDLAVATVQKLGQALDVGAPRDVVLTFTHGVVVLGRCGDEVVAVVADSECNVGLLVNHVRRLMSHTEERGA